MSGKYTVANAVLLKKEIQALQKELPLLLERRNSIEKECLESEQRYFVELHSRRSAFKKLENGMAQKLLFLSNQESFLLEKILTLLEKAKKIELLYQTLKKGVAEIKQPQPPDFSFVEKVVENLKKDVDTFSRQREELLRESDSFKEKRDILRLEVSSLKEKKSILENEMNLIINSIKSGNDKNGKLGRRYVELTEKISLFETRERDLLIMEERLKPEYQAIYQATQGK